MLDVKIRSVDCHLVKRMPEKITHRVKLDALTLVAVRHTGAQAAHLMHISKPTIARAKRRQQLYGDIEGGKKKCGPRAKFTLEIINVPHSFPCSVFDRLIRSSCK